MPALFTPTVDPHVVIEAQAAGLVTYRNTLTGERWQVIGTCDRRGNCIVGAHVGGVTIESLDHLARLKAERGASFGEAEKDTPVTPHFEGCCPFTYAVLPPA